MNINGENGLACITSITTKPMTIRPLPHMFVIKDLVIGIIFYILIKEKIKLIVMNNIHLLNHGYKRKK